MDSISNDLVSIYLVSAIKGYIDVCDISDSIKPKAENLYSQLTTSMNHFDSRLHAENCAYNTNTKLRMENAKEQFSQKLNREIANSIEYEPESPYYEGKMRIERTFIETHTPEATIYEMDTRHIYPTCEIANEEKQKKSVICSVKDYLYKFVAWLNMFIEDYILD